MAPESPSGLQLKSSSLRDEVSAVRADTRAGQLSSVSPQSYRLNDAQQDKETRNISRNIHSNRLRDT